uniref:C-type lectin domain-containing protein n=1 Tax=Scophthalmus maximus TaxID=52904 RepID=A0A8D3AGA2_SCOMX
HNFTFIILTIIIITLPWFKRICKKCHNSWKQFESKCYYFSARTLTWSSSRAWCRTQGGDLLIVDSEQEQRFIFDSSSSVESSGARLWIGLTDEEQEGDWRWVDGGRVTSDGEDCGHIDTTEKALKSWMDGSCKIAYRWICEKDA